MITFAHEMNGNWYPWGLGGQDKGNSRAVGRGLGPRRHRHGGRGAGLIDWVWAPNDENGAGPVARYWPGDKYVDTVGIDGYLRSDSATYQSVFRADGPPTSAP